MGGRHDPVRDRDDLYREIKRDPSSSVDLAVRLGWKLTRVRDVLHELKQDGRIEQFQVRGGGPGWGWEYRVTTREKVSDQEYPPPVGRS